MPIVKIQYMKCVVCRTQSSGSPTLCDSCYHNRSVIDDLNRIIDVLRQAADHPNQPTPGAPVPMLLRCPVCHERHVDKGEFATKPHHTHACQRCGECWRPALVATVGVQYLPGFKDAE